MSDAWTDARATRSPLGLTLPHFRKPLLGAFALGAAVVEEGPRSRLAMSMA